MNTTRDLIREILALVLAVALVLTVAALFSYSSADPALNRAVPSRSVENVAGLFGAYLAGFLVDVLGAASWMAPAFLAGGVARLFFPCWRLSRRQAIGVGLLAVWLPVVLECAWVQDLMAGLAMHGGGMVGRIGAGVLRRYLGELGLALVVIAGGIMGLRLLVDAPLAVVVRGLGQWLRPVHIPESEVSPSEDVVAPHGAPSALPAAMEPSPDADGFRPLLAKRRKPAVLRPRPEARPMEVDAERPAVALPPVELLAAPSGGGGKVPRAILDRQAQQLAACFADFGVQGEVQAIQPGPVITLFEFKPAPGIKVSRIANLGDDLALALKARSVRIIAPLPGKDTVGIEIPNEQRQGVALREILESPAFGEHAGLLPLALGKDAQGGAKVVDLARMPHLLVAGATGAGKSVCLNCLLLSLIYRHSPKSLRLLLVDPKRIELATYSALPHLVHPVVTDMHLAKNALDWAVSEMEERYEAMARIGVRHITSYNQKLEELGAQRPEQWEGLRPFPFLVIIIDELADLMMTAAKDVETSIVRLAQLARAAGIHLILATQRPSVDVVTGIIKANFPSRIAFQVSSKHDSRTILDTVGAEHLLGQGDMLYKGSGGGLERVHGAFVGDEEIAAVVGFWARQQPQCFEVDFAQWGGGNDDGTGETTPGDVLDDPKYAEALELVYEQGRASISMIQRRLRIGFNRAARFIEQMEQDGIIGPADGSKPRLVRRRE